jgi:hypothetical protein
MDKIKAQQIIKAALDLAIKAGVLQNLESAALTAQAWHIITEILKNDSAE